MGIEYYIAEIQDVSFHFGRGDVSISELKNYTKELEENLKKEGIDLMEFTNQTKDLKNEMYYL